MRYRKKLQSLNVLASQGSRDGWIKCVQVSSELSCTEQRPRAKRQRKTWLPGTKGLPTKPEGEDHAPKIKPRSWEVARGECQQWVLTIALNTVAGDSSTSKNTRRMPDAQQSFPRTQGNIFAGWEKRDLSPVIAVIRWSAQKSVSWKVNLLHLGWVQGPSVPQTANRQKEPPGRSASFRIPM